MFLHLRIHRVIVTNQTEFSLDSNLFLILYRCTSSWNPNRIAKWKIAIHYYKNSWICYWKTTHYPLVTEIKNMYLPSIWPLIYSGISSPTHQIFEMSSILELFRVGIMIIITTSSALQTHIKSWSHIPDTEQHAYAKECLHKI